MSESSGEQWGGKPAQPGTGGPASRAAVEGCTFEIAEGKARIAVVVRNRGEAPLFAISQVRRLTIDGGGDTLTLWMTERGAPVPAEPLRHLTLPNSEVIPGGEERTLKAELPAKMTRLLAVGKDGEIDFDVLDVAATTRVVVKLSVADAPFYFNPSRRSLLEQLQDWGEDVEAGARRTGRDPGPDPDLQLPR